MRWVIVSAISSLCCGAAYYNAPRYHPSSQDPSAFGGQFYDGALNHPQVQTRYVAMPMPAPIYQPMVRIREDGVRVPHRHRLHPRPIAYSEPTGGRAPNQSSEPRSARAPSRKSAPPLPPEAQKEQQRMDNSIAPRNPAYDRTHPTRNP
jgi:hypothetical protein